MHGWYMGVLRGVEKITMSDLGEETAGSPDAKNGGEGGQRSRRYDLSRSERRALLTAAQAVGIETDDIDFETAAGMDALEVRTIRRLAADTRVPAAWAKELVQRARDRASLVEHRRAQAQAQDEAQRAGDK